MIGVAISGLMMLHRIHALYRHHSCHHYIVCTLGCILTGFIVLNSWLLTHAEAEYIGFLPGNSHVTSCTMIFNPDQVPPVAATASAWLPLLYDTTVLVLTLARATPGLFSKSAGVMMHELVREGVLYYSVIFAVTLALTLMIETADPSIKNIAAQLELCLTAAMMSRITLGLKQFSRNCSRVQEFRLEYMKNAVAWQEVAHPTRAHAFRRGHIQHVERFSNDSRESFTSQHSGVDLATKTVEVVIAVHDNVMDTRWDIQGASSDNEKCSDSREPK